MTTGFDLTTAYGSVVLDASGVSAGINAAKNAIDSGLDGLSARFDRIGEDLGNLGGAITKLTAPIGLALGFAVKGAMDFDEAMTNSGAVLGKTQGEMKDLNNTILEMGAHTRAGPQKVAEAFYDIVGGVADANTHMAILQASTDLAEAGNAELAGTTKALISVMNSYSFGADKASFASDVLTQTVNKGVGSMDDFAAAFPQVTGLAHTLGIGFDQLGAQTAFLTTKGFSASQATTQLRAMMVALLNPNEKMKTALQEAGFASGEAAVKAKGLVGAYNALKDGSSSFQANMAGTVGSVEALNGALALTGDGAEEALGKFSQGLDGATASAKELQNQSPAAQFDLLKSNIAAVGITVGRVLLPPLNELMKKLGPIIDQVASWINANPGLVQGIALIGGGLAILGPLLIGAGMAFSAFGTIIGLIASPVTLVVAAIAALVWAFENNFGGIRDIVQNVLGSLSTVFSDIGRFIEVGIARFQQFGARGLLGWLFSPDEDGSSAIQWLGEIMSNLFGKVFGLSEAKIEAFRMEWDSAWRQIVDLVQTHVAPIIASFFDFLGQAWAIVGPKLNELFVWFTQTALPALVGFVNNTVLPGIKAFIDFLGAAWEFIKPGLLSMLDWFMNTGMPAIVGFVRDHVMPVISTLFDILKTVWEVVGPPLGDLFDWFTKTGFPKIQEVGQKLYDTVLKPIVDLLAGIWGVVEGGLKLFAAWFKDNIPEIQRFVEGLLGVFKDLIETVGRALDALGNIQRSTSTIGNGLANGQWNIGDVFRAAGNAINSEFFHHAAGGMLDKGWNLLGDGGGPELVYSPDGSAGQVFTGSQTQQMMQGGGGPQIGQVVIYANSSAEGAAAADGFAARFDELFGRRG